MLRDYPVCLPIAEPLALIDATFVLAVQVLIAQHPDGPPGALPPAPGGELLCFVDQPAAEA